MEQMIKEQREEMQQLIELIPSRTLNNYNQNSDISYSSVPYPQGSYCDTPQPQMSSDMNAVPLWPSNNVILCGEGASACANMSNSNNSINLPSYQAEAMAENVSVQIQQSSPEGSAEQQLIIRILFPIIQELYPNLAGIIKDTLLRMDTPNLLNMLRNDEYLKMKLEEIVAVVTTITYAPTDRNKILWKYIYPYVMRICPNDAVKITRILLNCDYTILLDMLINTYILNIKVEEAKTFLVGPLPKINHMEMCVVPLIKNLDNETDHIQSEFDNCKLLYMLKHNEWFKNKVEEAMSQLIISAPAVEQTKILKSCLSDLIKYLCPFYAEAVTSKLLESSNSDLFNLLRDHKYLVVKVEKAIEELIDSSPPQEQRTMLGRHLYHLVQVLHPHLAHIITEMLLDCGKIEVLEMLKSEELLKLKAAEAANKCHRYHQGNFLRVPVSQNM